MVNKPDKDTLVNLLSKVSLFQHAENSVLTQLAGKTNFSLYKPGDTIIHKGELGETMFIIFSGKLKVHDDDHQVAFT